MRCGFLRLAIAAALVCAAPALAQMSPLTGDWTGVLDVPGTRLRLGVHVDFLADGTLSGTFDSPDEGVRALKLDEVRLDLNAVRLRCDAVGMSFLGRISGDVVRGTLRQRGFAVQLTLTRGVVPAPVRPQTPRAPFPYKREDVAFINPKAGGITLAGTFTAPLNVSRAPAVVLISMSGPQDRDETLYDHKPFLLLADQLTRAGIAVLRYDDRGVGHSHGDYASATTADFASDAEAALNYLRNRDDVDRSHIGLVGHSEGAAIVPLIARDTVDFVVLLSPPGVRGDELTLDQAVALKQIDGSNETECATERAWVAKLIDIVKSETTREATAQRARAGLAAWPDVDRWLAALNNAWFRYFLSFDPVPAFERLKQPALIVQGELDRQVEPTKSRNALEAALEKAHNRKVTFRLMPGLNHMLQNASTGAPQEYARIEETIAPAALSTITRWVRQQAGLEKKR